jgi:hypothetical protein
MSSPVFAAPLRLECRPSRYLMLAVTVVHGGALLVLIPIDASWWVKLPVAAAVVVQWIVTWRHYVMLSAPAAVKSLVRTTDGNWELCRGDGGCFAAQLLPAAYVHPLLVVMRFITEDRRRYAVVLPCDSLDTDSHRRLRVQLRLQGGERG